MNTTEHKTNISSYADNINTSVNAAKVGDTPTDGIEILLADDDRYLATVQDVYGFVALLAKHRYTPNDVWSRCNPAMWAVWCDIAWNSPELAEYSDGDRGVA